ncbi:MAG: hypothetical protein LLF92_05805 [Planctomycetaceae bacterium]|nr:hypothetical protein [Planctomycetaceae bacterium]
MMKRMYHLVWTHVLCFALISLSVVYGLTTPALQTEPNLTRGTCNQVNWGNVGGADEYLAECAEDSSFNSILESSGWVIDTDYEFCDLTLGQKYWYRAKARSLPDLETWLQTNSSDFASDVQTSVDVYTLPGNVILAKNIVSNSDTLGGTTYSDQYGAEWLNVNFFQCTQSCTLTSISAYLNITQSVTLEFVVYESSSQNGTYSRVHKNTLSSGTGTKWFSSGSISRSLTAGKYYGIGVSRSYFIYTTPYFSSGGSGPVSWGTKIGAGSYSYPAPSSISNEGHSYEWYQRYTTSGEQGFKLSGNIKSTSINLPTGGNWGNIYFSPYTPYGTSLIVDVLDGSDSILINNVQSGANLSGLTAQQIKIRANLATTLSGYTPMLYSWAVDYTNPSGAEESSWSNVESSTQTFPVDFSMNGAIGMVDFAILSNAWQSSDGDSNWNAICDVAQPANNVIDIHDLAVFVEFWLESIN